MSKWLIIDPQLKLVTMLHDVQSVFTNVEWELESRLKPRSLDCGMPYFESK